MTKIECVLTECIHNSDSRCTKTSIKLYKGETLRCEDTAGEEFDYEMFNCDGLEVKGGKAMSIGMIVNDGAEVEKVDLTNALRVIKDYCESIDGDCDRCLIEADWCDENSCTAPQGWLLGEDVK